MPSKTSRINNTSDHAPKSALSAVGSDDRVTRCRARDAVDAGEHPDGRRRRSDGGGYVRRWGVVEEEDEEDEEDVVVVVVFVLFSFKL